MQITIGMDVTGVPFEVTIDEAVHWLIGDDGGYGYNRRSVHLYDFANGDSLAAAVSPSGRATFEDLGRMTCLGASLRYARGQELIGNGHAAPWPSEPLPRLQDLSALSDEAFLNHEGVSAAWKLHTFFTSLDDVGTGTASKLLHLKAPTFYPIADSAFRNAYRRAAVQRHNRSHSIPGTRQRSRAEIRAYWLAFRADLKANEQPLRNVRTEFARRTSGERIAHVERLSALADLRLLDMLAWGVGSGRIGKAIRGDSG